MKINYLSFLTSVAKARRFFSPPEITLSCPLCPIRIFEQFVSPKCVSDSSIILFISDLLLFLSNFNLACK